MILADFPYTISFANVSNITLRQNRWTGQKWLLLLNFIQTRWI